MSRQISSSLDVDATDRLFRVQRRYGVFFSRHPEALPIRASAEYFRGGFRGDRKLNAIDHAELDDAVVRVCRRKNLNAEAALFWIRIDDGVAARQVGSLDQELNDVLRGASRLAVLAEQSIADGGLTNAEARQIERECITVLSEVHDVRVATKAAVTQ